MKRKCPQCWKDKPWPKDFVGKSGKPTRLCNPCKRRYYGWANKSPAERMALVPEREDPTPSGAMLFVRRGFAQ